MPPPATTRSQWVGLNGTSCFLSQTITNAENSLHARQNSNGPSGSPGPINTLILPPPGSPGPSGSPGPINTLIPPPPGSSGPPPDSASQFHIAGLSRSIFIVVIVIGVVVLTVLSFLAVCYFKRWKRNRPVVGHMLSVQMQDINRISHFGDAPRPDSITLPMQTAPRPNPPDTLPANTAAAAAAAAAGRPLGAMLNRFHSPSNSASHRRLGSGDSTYRSRVTTSAWDNDRPTRAVSSANILPTSSLCGPSSGTYQGVPMSSQPSTPGPVSPVPFSAYRSPSITSLDSNPPRIPARGKRPFRDTIMSVPRPLLMSNKLRKKIRPITENKAISEPALGAAPMAGSAGYWRASTGSMSNWVSWWESSSDEEEEEAEATTKRKRRKK